MSGIRFLLGTFGVVCVTVCAAAQEVAPMVTSTPETPYFVIRGDMTNSLIRFARDREGRVAFLGGSITHAEGWRPLIGEYLSRRFPDTTFDFIDAGIPSTDTTLAPARLERDVFGRGPVDLLFVEFAVNDETNGRSVVEMRRGMEGVLRRARLLRPEADIVVMYFVDAAKMDVYNAGGVPVVVKIHEEVTGHYGVPSLDLAREVTERIRGGEFDWAKFGGNEHPAAFGHAVYRDAIVRLLEEAWRVSPAPDASVKPHPMPEDPLDPNSYFMARFLDIGAAVVGEGWKLSPSWRPDDGAGVRKGFVDVPALVAEEPGAALTLRFEGTGVGIVVTAGPDAGAIAYRIDNGPERRVDLYTQWSGQLHLPWAHMLDAELAPGEHRLSLRVDGISHPNSRGRAVRIVRFIAN